MAKKKKTAVAKTKSALPATAYAEYEGKGFEHQTQEDIAIPFLAVLQSTSPQVGKDGIKGAKPGLLFNTVTQEVLKETLFVPAITQHVFVEWVPRDKGGGFVAVHQILDESVKKAKEASHEYGKLKIGENDLVETFYIYGVLANEEEPLGLAVLAFTSTKIKVYKRFNTRLQTFMLKLKDGRKIRPPMFSHLMHITGEPESNNKGDYFNFKLSSAGENLKEALLAPDDPRFLAGAECYDLIESNSARVAYETVTPDDDGDGERGDDPF